MAEGDASHVPVYAGNIPWGTGRLLKQINGAAAIDVAAAPCNIFC